MHRLPHGHGEDIEADVVVEDGVRDAERRLVVEEQEGLPLRSGGETSEGRHDRTECESADAYVAAERGAARLEEVTVNGSAIAGRQAPRDLDVDLDYYEEHQERGRSDDDLPQDARPEHGAVADFAEPEPVHVRAEKPTGHGEHKNGQGDDDARDDPAARTRSARRRRLLARVDWAHVVHSASMTYPRAPDTRPAPIRPGLGLNGPASDCSTCSREAIAAKDV